MAETDSPLDAQDFARARALLREPDRREPGMKEALAAAGFMAVTALGLAVAMLTGTPLS